LSVQALPSSQETLFGVLTQPPSTQASSVQALRSSQSKAAQGSQPGMALQPGRPQSKTLEQPPFAESQLSAVQESPSSQLTGMPDWQAPPVQVSPVVQAFPSSQEAAFGALTQAPPEQESSVQALPSSQSMAVPESQESVMSLQNSIPLQALPSSQVTGFPDRHSFVPPTSQVSMPLQ
jgi:hypothetical protein